MIREWSSEAPFVPDLEALQPEDATGAGRARQPVGGGAADPTQADDDVDRTLSAQSRDRASDTSWP